MTTLCSKLAVFAVKNSVSKECGKFVADGVLCVILHIEAGLYDQYNRRKGSKTSLIRSWHNWRDAGDLLTSNVD